MKKTVKRLTQDFNNVEELLINLRENQQLSYVKISKYFNSLGYFCSTSLIHRLYKKYNININRNRCGKNNSFYGKKHSNETKDSMSEIRKKLKYSKGEKNYFYGKSKEKSPNWKGGISTKRALFYASQAWYEKRIETELISIFQKIIQNIRQQIGDVCSLKGGSCGS